MDTNFSIADITPGTKGTGWLTVCSRADGQDWKLPVLFVAGSGPGPVLVVTAAVHGDEYEGVETIPRVYEQVDPESLRGKLVMVPVCNPPAYEAAQRSSPIDDLNLARVFPGEAAGTITQRIAHYMVETLLKPADFYIDLHSGGVYYNIPTLIGYGHSDDKRGRQAEAAARAFGAPVMWAHPQPLPPGRTISTATDLGIPCLYTEAPGGGYARADDVTCFVQGIVNVMRHLNMLDGEPEPRPVTHFLRGGGDMDSVLSTPCAGYFRADVDLLDAVQAGQPLGRVSDLFGQTRAEIVADRDGIVILLRRFHRVHAGDSVAHVTTPSHLQTPNVQ